MAIDISYKEAQAMLRAIDENCTSDADVALANLGFEKLKLIKPSRISKVKLPKKKYRGTYSTLGGQSVTIISEPRRLKGNKVAKYNKKIGEIGIYCFADYNSVSTLTLYQHHFIRRRTGLKWIRFSVNINGELYGGYLTIK